jgi:hypothetical protein
LEQQQREITTAIARELAAFLWAIGQQVAPQKPAT